MLSKLKKFFQRKFSFLDILESPSLADSQPFVAQTPMATATVTTPATPQAPKGYMWDKLKNASGTRELKQLKEEALLIGYATDGLFIKAVNARLK